MHNDCGCLYTVRNSISGARHHSSRFFTSTPRSSPLPRPPVHPYLTAVPSTSRITPSALSTRPPPTARCPTTRNCRISTIWRKGRVARWEAWATELRQGRDADVYLENREDVIREMVSGWRAMYHIPLIQRRPQLQAHSGARPFPTAATR